MASGPMLLPARYHVSISARGSAMSRASARAPAPESPSQAMLFPSRKWRTRPQRGARPQANGRRTASHRLAMWSGPTTCLQRSMRSSGK